MSNPPLTAPSPTPAPARLRCEPLDLAKANEAFVARFIKELDSSIDLPTLYAQPYQDALASFLHNHAVQGLILAPLDGESELDSDLLQAIWAESRLAGGEPLIALPADFDWARVAKTYQHSIRRQMLADPNLRQLLTALSALRASDAATNSAAALDRLVGPVVAFDLSRYANTVKKAYSYLRLGSLDSEWTHYERRVRLENIYVPQSVKQALPPRDLTRDYMKVLKREGRTSGLPSNEEDALRRKAEYQKLSSRPLMDVVNDRRQRLLVILGDPGLGKSTLLKYLALRWAEDMAQSLTFMIELRHTERDIPNDSFLQYIEKSNHHLCSLPQMELHEYLTVHETLFLFDGLDEVSPAHRDDAVQKIVRFAQQYERARIIVTTRIHGYHPGSKHPEIFRDAGFQQFTLQDFDDVEIERFIRAWHKEAFDNTQERTRFEKRLQNAITDSPSIHELAANPLLLTMMAILSRTQELPRERCRLYDRCAELLLKNWDLDKFPELAGRHDTKDLSDKLGPDQKMRILERVAATMQRERAGLESNLISHENLKCSILRELDQLCVPQAWSVVEDLIAMLRERNFMLAYVGDDQYAFVHRTFLEYFCARDLKYQLEKTSTLPIEALQGLFREKWKRDEWQEILRLLCGLIGAEFVGRCVSELLNEARQQEDPGPVLLASECLREVREFGLLGEQRQRTRLQLLSLLRFYGYYDSHVELSVRRDEIELSRRLGYPARDDLIKLEEEAGAMRAPSRQDIPLVQEELRSATFRAVQELARGWKDDPATLPWLMESARRDGNYVVRLAALQELAQGWRNDPNVLQTLKDSATEDDNVNVRQRAVREVARVWGDHPDTLPWLKLVATLGQLDPLHRKSFVTRLTAVQELARGWRDDPDTLCILKDLATGDVDGNVRQEAVTELTRYWSDDPHTLRILQDRAVRDWYSDVRRVSLRALTRDWKHDLTTLTVLKECIRLDENNAIRLEAVEDVVANWRDDPETPPWLRALAANDENGDIRKLAIQELIKMWRNDAETTILLRDRSERDESPSVRQLCLTELVSRPGNT